jgi:hypothetical protein
VGTRSAGEATAAEAAAEELVAAEARKRQADDVKARGVMTLHLSRNYASMIRGVVTARDAWLALKATFAEKSSARVVQLLQAFNALVKQQGETVAQFGGRVFGLRMDILDAGGEKMSDEQVSLRILDGLKGDRRFDILVEIIRQGSDWEPRSILGRLMTREASLGATSVAVKEEDSAAVDNGGFGYAATQTGVKGPECWFCEEPGHFKKDCSRYKEFLRDKERKDRKGKRGSQRAYFSAAEEGF